MVDILPDKELEKLKGSSIYKYSNEIVTFHWKNLSVTIHQMNDNTNVSQQTNTLLSLINRKACIKGITLKEELVKRINGTKSVYGVEINPEVDNRVNELVSIICLNTNCLVLSGDTLFDENLNQVT